MVFIQLAVKFKWTHHWRKGHVKAACLQGKKRDTDTLGKLYLRQPKNRRLPGFLKVVLLKSCVVSMCQNAPRVWWEEFTGFLLSLGFTHSRTDVAFIVFYSLDGDIGILIIIHIDDVQISNDGTKATEAIVKKIHDKYPFGEWVNAYEVKKVSYTGRTIELDGEEVLSNQTEFVNVRMNHLPLRENKNRSRDDPCDETETADF